MAFATAFLSLLVATSARADLTPISSGLINRADSTSNNAIIQLFEWNWDSIAAECKSFIGPAGYGYVQVSPPQEHLVGSQWWTDYQPISYQIFSKRGSRAQFQAMVKACHDVNVKVLTDTIWNHMAGVDNGTGTAGSTFTHYTYPNIYIADDFHHCGLTPGDDVVNNTDRAQVQTCELSNLADLKTESDYVRGKLSDFGNDMISLGVDGFRLDAAKMIPADDIAAIIAKMKTKPSFITQEVFQGDGEEVQPSEYVKNGNVQEFRYTRALLNSFSSGTINNLTDLDSKGWVPSASANVFVCNHDTERSGPSLNYTSPNNLYTLAHVFMLAYPYGTPTVLSSYNYSSGSPDDGAPSNGAGSCSGSQGTGGWLCQHRWSPVTGMLSFYNNVINEKSITSYVAPSGTQLAFGRGNLGFVAINIDSSAWSNTFSTTLADGKYCDVISGPMSATKCSGNEITVAKGSFTVEVPAHSAIALHTNAMSGKATSSTNGGFRALPSLAAGLFASVVAVTLAF